LQEKKSLEREQGHEFPGAPLGTGRDALFTCFYSVNSAGIFKQSMRARNRIGLSHWPARLHSLAELIPWNRFLGSLKVKKFGLSTIKVGNLAMLDINKKICESVTKNFKNKSFQDI
jgi:hypothetical protein